MLIHKILICFVFSAKFAPKMNKIRGKCTQNLNIYGEKSPPIFYLNHEIDKKPQLVTY